MSIVIAHTPVLQRRWGCVFTHCLKVSIWDNRSFGFSFNSFLAFLSESSSKVHVYDPSPDIYSKIRKGDNSIFFFYTSFLMEVSSVIVEVSSVIYSASLRERCVSAALAQRNGHCVKIDL